MDGTSKPNIVVHIEFHSNIIQIMWYVEWIVPLLHQLHPAAEFPSSPVPQIEYSSPVWSWPGVSATKVQGGGEKKKKNLSKVDVSRNNKKINQPEGLGVQVLLCKILPTVWVCSDTHSWAFVSEVADSFLRANG